MPDALPPRERPTLERLERISARPEPWALGAVLAALMTGWAAGSPWFGAAILPVTYMLWQSARDRVRLKADLLAARADRDAMEEALRQSQKMEAIGRLTGGIAHDFNNHLTVISSNVELVKRRLDSSDEKLLRYLDAAMQGVQRAATLTGRLLSFTREQAPEPEAIDVARFLGGLCDLLRRTLGEGETLQVRLPDERWFVWADVNEMENALLSLAVNARNRMSVGGVLVLAATNVRLNDTFAAAHPRILPGDYVRIAFGDATLAEADPPQPWQTADDLADAGLSLARGFVRQMGGCLLRSGSLSGPPSLRLFLPRYHHPAPAGLASRRCPGARPTILVVEDDAAVRHACVETLRDLDYTVLEAPDAMEAFRLIADHGGIDLLFSDLGLPGGVSGRALADAARNVDPGIRVLFSTGYAAVAASERGETPMLAKPFSPAELAQKVASVLNASAVVVRAETVQG
jgi:CheY-like chemotaxis protein